jgi:PhzF family phenazine biosynthesis protein
MSTYRFKQVDVFTDRPFFGNPVAVVLDADAIDEAQMQRIAAWTNLSETTFVLRPTTPEADYRLRIFYPRGELRFAGHPTVGSAHAVLEAGVVSPANGRFVQECGAGNLPMRVEGEGGGKRIYVEAPEARILDGPVPSREMISEALGQEMSREMPPLPVDNGPVWVFTYFDDVGAIQRMKPDMGALAKLTRDYSSIGFAVFALPAGGGAAVHLRCFAPAGGVTEDPVTGSANAGLPAYLAAVGQLGRVERTYVSTQGTEIGRDGRVFVRVLDDSGRAEIGGHAVTVIEGEIRV